jgi:hypothetical protein
MFASLITKPVSRLTLGAQAHNRLNAALIDEVSAAFQQQNWTCHICGTCLPEMMEADHTKGHKVSVKDGIKPICQFCHDRDHLLWAASRKRITLIHAPDLDHVEISQLSWAICTHVGREGFGFDQMKIMRDLDARREDAYDALGHNNLEAIYETIFAYQDARGEDAAREMVEEIDKHLRLAPAVLFETAPKIETWMRGGFRSVGEDWRERAVPKTFPGYGALKSAGDALKAKL